MSGERTPRRGIRWNAGKDLSVPVPVRPERVVEVRYDHMEGERFRHTAQFNRWRPDRDPRSCTYGQLEKPVTFSLGDMIPRPSHCHLTLTTTLPLHFSASRQTLVNRLVHACTSVAVFSATPQQLRLDAIEYLTNHLRSDWAIRNEAMSVLNQADVDAHHLHAT